VRDASQEMGGSKKENNVSIQPNESPKSKVRTRTRDVPKRFSSQTQSQTQNIPSIDLRADIKRKRYLSREFIHRMRCGKQESINDYRKYAL
jgi:hypothetical protein